MSDKFDFDSDFGNEYEQLTQLVLPTYDQLFPIVNAVLRSEMEEEANLLVVGAGGGKELITLGQYNSNWRITGVDPSEQMIEIARSKIIQANLEKRIELFKGFTQELPLERVYNGATCILVSHLLPDDGTQLSLLKAVAERLEAKSPFVLVSLHGDIRSPQFKKCFDAWKFSLAQQLDEQKLNNFLLKGQNSTYFVSEKRMEELLEQAGFHRVTRFFTTYLVGGWVATRK
jgi:tRNA (cmo5U34)-methyltransferase